MYDIVCNFCFKKLKQNFSDDIKHLMVFEKKKLDLT